MKARMSVGLIRANKDHAYGTQKMGGAQNGDVYYSPDRRYKVIRSNNATGELADEHMITMSDQTKQGSVMIPLEKCREFMQLLGIEHYVEFTSDENTAIDGIQRALFGKNWCVRRFRVLTQETEKGENA